MSVDPLGNPAISTKPQYWVVGKRQLGRTIDRYRVVVIEHDQLVEREMAGERGCLVADALHHVAVAGKYIGVMINDRIAKLGRQHPLRERHADRIAEPLAERPGR